MVAVATAIGLRPKPRLGQLVRGNSRSNDRMETFVDAIMPNSPENKTLLATSIYAIYAIYAISISLNLSFGSRAN